jgi:hypothetical protein
VSVGCEDIETLLLFAAMTRQSREIPLTKTYRPGQEAQDEFVRSVAAIENKHFGPYRRSDDE